MRLVLPYMPLSYLRCYIYSSHRLVLVLEQSCFIAQLGKPRSFTNSDGHTGQHEAIRNAMETNIYCENWGKIWPIACDSPNFPKFSTSKVLQKFTKFLDSHFFLTKATSFSDSVREAYFTSNNNFSCYRMSII